MAFLYIASVSLWLEAFEGAHSEEPQVGGPRQRFTFDWLSSRLIWGGIFFIARMAIGP